MHREPRPLGGLLVVVGLVAVGCTAGGSKPMPGPSVTPSPRVTPSRSATPVVIPGDVRTGEARIEITGALHARLDLTQLASPTVFSPPPGGMAVTWKDTRGDLFGIGGRSFTGRRETTASLVLSLAVRLKGGYLDLSSTGGRCTITMTRADASGLEGSFDCKDLGSDGRRIEAAGTFAASP